MKEISKSMFKHRRELQYKAILESVKLQKQRTLKISLFNHLKNELRKSFSLYKFESGLLESYFREISTFYLKLNLKNAMKVILIFWHFSIALNLYFTPGEFVQTLACMICMILISISYMFSVLLTSYKRIIATTIFVLMVCYISNSLTQSSVYELTETNFTPSIQINVLMFALLPVNLTVAFNIVLINFAVIISISMLNILRKKSFESVHHYMIGLEFIESLYDVPLFSKDVNVYRYFGALLLFMLSIVLISLYIHYMNNIRRRSAFWTLGKKVQTKHLITLTLTQQLKFIEAVMPSVVKKEYWAHSEEIKSDKWIYIKTFDNVSILFADIVGFTRMSSNKTALQVVLLLNDLFNRFDELCEATNCEKLGTLGDCYYCVAGCPHPRPDHAVCCIELGLGMCRVIKEFNEDNLEDVNMRVGIHTGRVNAAIIGKKRFKFDVYSNDVIIANSMESNGEPGRVHISEPCYDFVRGSYNVTKGKGLEIRSDEYRSIADSYTPFKLETYFVDPESAHFKLYFKRSRKKKQEFQVFHVHSFQGKLKRKKSSSDHSDSSSINSENDNSKLRETIDFIKDLRFDSDNQIKLFSLIPINSLTMMFHDKELEWHFRNFSLEEMSDITFENKNSARFFDCLICTLYCMLLSIEAFILFPDHLNYICFSAMICHILAFMILTSVSGWYCYVTYDQLDTCIKKLIYYLLDNFICKSIFCIFFQNSSTITVILLFYDCVKLYTDYSYTINFFLLIFSSTFIVPLYFAAEYLVKLFSSTILFVFVIFVFIFSPCVQKTGDYPNFYEFSPYTCLGAQNNTTSMFINRLKIGFISQIFIVYLLSILLIREIERNIRLWFFISREAEISREQIQIAKKNAEKVLYNIIPKYVFDNLMDQYEGNMENFNFSYAVTIPKCAVIFASLSNFFSKYYCEDYKSGENALKLLHEIIKRFDELIENPKYKDVEKIKTINDCYMVAAGLNTAETDKNPMKATHLISLLYYCFDLIKSIEHFNKKYLKGTDKFEIKIGYNFGTVTAGIISSTKPMYDIWGDTVNIASRMYSTGAVGFIQVPHYVEAQLSDYFEFRYRGKIFVKGKGIMDTYIVLERAVVKKSVNKKIGFTSESGYRSFAFPRFSFNRSSAIY